MDRFVRTIVVFAIERPIGEDDKAVALEGRDVDRPVLARRGHQDQSFDDIEQAVAGDRSDEIGQCVVLRFGDESLRPIPVKQNYCRMPRHQGMDCLYLGNSLVDPRRGRNRARLAPCQVVVECPDNPNERREAVFSRFNAAPMQRDVQHRKIALLSLTMARLE